MIEAKKLLGIPAILVSGPILFGLSDSVISIADKSNSKNEVAGKSSINATITITI